MQQSSWTTLRQTLFLLLASLPLTLTAAGPSAMNAASGTVSVAALVQELGEAYAPDKRTSIWEISIKKSDGQLVISGSTDNRKALSALKRKLRAQKKPALLQVRLLPDDVRLDLVRRARALAGDAE